MLQVIVVGKGFVCVTKFSIKCTATIKIMIPCHRVIVTVFTTSIRFLIYFDKYMNVLIQFFEIIPLIFSFPFFRQMFGGIIRLIYYFKCSLLLLGMAEEISSGHASIPTPIIFAVGCSMNTQVATTSLDISFKISFLVVIQYITCGT